MSSIDVLAPPPPPPPPPPAPEVQQETDTTPSTQPIVGIIYPPPEVRNIVDKTASFVARNGPEFEARIRQNEIGNPKFNFLNFGDPYHGYYQHKVKDFREGRVNDTLDDMLDESGDEEESEQVVNKVLDEIGIEISGKMAQAPSAVRGKVGENSKSSLPTDEEIEEQLAKLRS